LIKRGEKIFLGQNLSLCFILSLLFITEQEYHIIEDDSPRGLNRSWARLIQKVYEVDPLICPMCGGEMKIIAFIEDYKVVKKILDYPGIYEFERKRPPPEVGKEPDEAGEYIIDDYIDCEKL